MRSAPEVAEQDPIPQAAWQSAAPPTALIEVANPRELARRIAAARGPEARASYRSLLMRLRTCTHTQALRDALDGLAGIELHDTIDVQLRELVTQQAPGRKLTEAQVRAALSEILGQRTPLEYGVWVFQPWSGRLLHVLEREHFIAVRTNRNLYKITPAERDTLASKRIGIIGLSVGQSVALTLAMERGFGSVRLADFDRLELSNLNRLRGGLHNLGELKVRIAAREIAEIDPFLEVECHEQGINEDNIDAFLTAGGTLDALVEECDSIDIKFLARERARHHRIPVLMDTSDRGMFDLERFDLEPTRSVFHGLGGDIDHRTLRGLTYEQKIPHIVKLMGEAQISSRLRASMLEIDQTLVSWPQLASSVALGGAVVADVCRRVLLGDNLASGRHRVDLETLIAAPPAAEAPRSSSATHTASAWPSAQDLLQALGSCRPAAQALPRQLIARLVEAGCAAPSGGNLQPWRWCHAHDHLFLLRDGARASPWLSVMGLADHLALGAAAENVLLTAHREGLSVQLIEGGADHPFVCAFAFHRPAAGPVTPHDAAHDKLAMHIFERCTNREIAPRVRLEAEAAQAILHAAHSIPGVQLRLLTHATDLDRARDIICEATRCQFMNRAFHQGIVGEIRWSGAEAEASRDGIDLPSLALSQLDEAGLRMCRDWQVIDHLRHWRLGRGLARLPRRAIDGASAVGLLSVAGWRPDLYFAAGRAMQRLWLTCTARGVGLQPWSVLPYLYARRALMHDEGLEPEQRATLTQLWSPYRRLFQVDENTGQALLFRLCAAPRHPVHSLRRRLGDVLRFEA